MKVEFTYLVTSRIKFNLRGIRSWIKKIVEIEEKRPGNIHFVISGKDHIREVNKEFLNHDYDTDVISFADNNRDIINGEVFICQDVVIENARRYHVEDRMELMRVIVHGVLHLIGYEDNTEQRKEKMSEKENDYLQMAEENGYV